MSTAAPHTAVDRAPLFSWAGKEKVVGIKRLESGMEVVSIEEMGGLRGVPCVGLP